MAFELLASVISAFPRATARSWRAISGRRKSESLIKRGTTIRVRSPNQVKSIQVPRLDASMRVRRIGCRSKKANVRFGAFALTLCDCARGAGSL